MTKFLLLVFPSITQTAHVQSMVLADNLTLALFMSYPQLTFLDV